jgi:hypothetical protein
MFVRLLFLAGIACITWGLIKTAPDPVYVIKVNGEQAHALLDVIENSNAPHLQVKGVYNLVLTQLSAQEDSLIRTSDTLKKVKP